MLYPQFLFALMRLAEKRKSGFQEVRTMFRESIECMLVAICGMNDILTNLSLC